MVIIKTGAESQIILEKNRIKKARIKKNYRHSKIDKKLRKRRTEYEVRILKKLFEKNIPVPEFIKRSDTEIQMEFLKGSTIKERFDKNTKDFKKYAKEIGQLIALIHDHNIIHGDLTTSNLILAQKNGKIYLIDFGLSYHSHRYEDKAVDLRVLEQALKSGHPTISEQVFRAVLLSYEKASTNGKAIIKRLEKVKQRGRYK